MEGFGKYEDSQDHSGSTSDSNESEYSGDDNLLKNSTAADGRNPELEFLLGHTEHRENQKNQSESHITEHVSRQDVADGNNPLLESLLGGSEPQYPNKYSIGKVHKSRQNKEKSYVNTEKTEKSKVANRVTSLLTTDSMYDDSHIVKLPHVKSPQALNKLTLLSAHNDPYYKMAQYYSYPIIDMTKAHRIGTPQFRKIRVQSSGEEELKLEVSHMFNVSVNKVHVIEVVGREEEVLLKTIIVVLPESIGEEFCPLLIELYESMLQVHPQLMCVRLPVRERIKDVKKLLAEELSWKGLVLCENGNVLQDDLTLRSCDFGNLARLQSMKQSCLKIDFVYQPRSDITCSYSIEVDMNSSMFEVKKKFKEHFQDEIKKQKPPKESTIHFCFQGRLLEDRECVGFVLRKNIKEEKISIHFGAEDSISIDLKFKVSRKTQHRLFIVSREISTAALRTKVSKLLGVDPKAVKLTFNDKLLDEHDDLSKVYKERWQSGCRIAAGIKKYKTLRIKHPTEFDEKPFNMYMLDPVSELKKKIAEEWGLNLLQISLLCRDIRMKHRQPLQYYPIKNNMEISLQLYQHRIILKVVVLFGKRKITLIIDNIEVTTVDDLLRFCAHHYGYARERSRGIYKGHCLDRTCSLADQGIKSGDTVIISYFDQPNLLQGNLIHILMGDENGRMVKRFGTISSGHLLHAPKTVEAPETSDTCIDNGHLPEGIKICDTKEGVSTFPRQMGKSNQTRGISGGKKHSAKIDMKNKSKFLIRARRLIQQKYSKTQHQEEKNASFYLGEDSKELELDEETGRKTLMPSKDASPADTDSSITEVKSKFNEQHGQRQIMFESTDATNRDEQSETGAMIEKGVISERFKKAKRTDKFESTKSEMVSKLEGSENSEWEEKFEREVKSKWGAKSEKDEQQVRGEIESDGPTTEDNFIICQKVKCIENCCKKIREVQSEKALDEFQRDCMAKSTPCKPRKDIDRTDSDLMKHGAYEKNLNEMRYHDEISLNEEKEKSKSIDIVFEGVSGYCPNSNFEHLSRMKSSFDRQNDLSGIDTETSGCESSHNQRTKLNIEPPRENKADDSSDIDHVTSSHGEDCLCNRICLSREKFTKCPFLQFQNGIHPRSPRTHTRSESAANVIDLLPAHPAQGQIHLNRTYPSFGGLFFNSNSHLETAGITLPLLSNVGRSLGNKWRPLLRALSVEETELDDIEHKNRNTNNGLSELGVQALITWKQRMGSAATKDCLLGALQVVGLKSVAEKCVNVGYSTA